MAMIAMAIPILPGKKAQWLEMSEELRGRWAQDFKASRERAGVHERTFLQETPMGDLVIVTLEGADPAAALGTMMAEDSPFTRWMNERTAEIHGMDLSAGPPPMPTLVADSRG